MNKEVAQEFQIPECDRKRFFSVYDDKNNKAPAASRAEWYEFVGIGLGNGDDTGPEDNRSEEHTSELQSLMRISYAAYCLQKKKKQNNNHTFTNETTHKHIQPKHNI